MLLKACWSRDGYFGNVMNQAARAALLSKDFDTAERCVQRSLLVLLKTPGVYYVDTGSYLSVPTAMRATHARGLLAAGRADEALAEARDVLRATPGNADLVIALVPELEKRGRTADANGLYAAVRAAYQTALAAYPASAPTRNASAWLAANCRRDLDTALADAEAAVAAEPTSTSYRDTLAEVHFRRGDRAKAVEVVSALLAENPRSRAYRRNLERYRTGDPAAPLPDADED